MNRREFVIGSASATGFAASAVAEEKTTDGGYAEVSWADRPERALPVLPAGAGSVADFNRRCTGCGLCAAACPRQILRPVSRGGVARVELDFRYGWCRPDCTECSGVCPAGAIRPLTVKEKRGIHAGFAVWDRTVCIRTANGDECHACEKHCPVKAVKLVGGFPVVDRAACIGCGACEHYCPARPLAAIRVMGLDRQREVRPIAEADLIAEMRVRFEEGASLVVAKDGIITFWSDGKGISPIKEALALDSEALRGAVVLDRVVGKAAASRHIAGGVRKVVTPVIAAKAKAMLEAAGVEVEAGEIVEKILNRDRTAECPLDAGLVTP